MSIDALAAKFAEHEQQESGGEQSIFGEECWVWVFEKLTPQELAELTVNGPEFLLEDHSNNPLWEKVQDLIGKWETMTSARASILVAADHPEARALLSGMLEEMIGEDEEMWQILAERASSSVAEGGDSWMEPAELAINAAVTLIYDFGYSPRDVFDLLNGAG